MKRIFTTSIVLAILLSSCTGDHFITDKNYRQKVETQFKKQKDLAKNRSEQLFGIFDKDLTVSESEALKFLYAYSSLNDLADYSGDFFLQNIRASFAARDTFTWGHKIPENLFRHFVLPIRINNENLDSARWVIFAELKDRLKSMPMKEAVLEVNHWCHEKVTYRGTDGRTSSPLATIKTAFGRCGEESTLTVAALRAVGIPARQCYTPRWAHCDDNHAWVEVWVDGKWHFIGACEPDADLDLAWFTKSAKRAMLVNTTVFGDYEGPEDILQKDALFTRINVLENYAPTKRVYARIMDAGNQVVDSAKVEFQLYNYAEFYPLSTQITGKDGLCSFKTGFGDLIVWSAKNGKYGFGKLDTRTTDTITIRLEMNASHAFDLDLDLVPPSELEVTVKVSDSARNRNNERLAFEDGLRSSYEATFIDSLKSSRFARIVKLNPDTLWSFFNKSRGNWRGLTTFITQTPEDKRPLIFALLDNISEKDLRDADTAVLLDQIMYSQKFKTLATSPADFNRYILSPRIDNEYLKPFKSLFQNGFPASFIDSARQDPQHIARWIRKNIVLNTISNYSRAPITPTGIYELRVADAHSADIFFVALCRSFGIPARLDPATKVPQFNSAGFWKDVFLFEQKPTAIQKGTLVLTNPVTNDKKPEYTIHYTVETFKDGWFKTLDYEGSELVQSYPCTLEIPAGQCMMVTGNRLADGTVLAKLKVFDVKAGMTAAQSIDLRKNMLPLPEYGRIDPKIFKEDIKDGIIIAWIEPDKEPTKHLLAELREGKSEFEQWNGRLNLVFPDESQMSVFISKETSLLPKGTEYIIQGTFPIKMEDLKLNGATPKHLPIVVYIDREGVIRYLTEGYRIGTGKELLTLIN